MSEREEAGSDRERRPQRVGSYGVCVQDERILLVEFAKGGRWGMPGGGVDHGEHPVDAVIRELAEETGYDVRVNALLGVHNMFFRGRGPETHAYALFYAVTVIGGRLRDEVGGSTSRAAWFDLDAVGDLPQVGNGIAVGIDLHHRRPADGRSPLTERLIAP